MGSCRGATSGSEQVRLVAKNEQQAQEIRAGLRRRHVTSRCHSWHRSMLIAILDVNMRKMGQHWQH